MWRFSEQSINDQNSAFLGKLIKSGIIDTPFNPMDENRSQYLRYGDWFLKLGNQKKCWPNPDSYEMWTHAKTQRWQESHLDPVTHPVVTDYWAIELAQFAVPEGHIGWLKYIEQVITDVTGSYYPTNTTFWGSPYYVDPDVDNLRWYLKLTPFYGTLPARYNLSSTIPIPVHSLPGVPYTELPQIDGLWYPAHRRSEMKLIVPGRYVLRFFMISPPLVNYQWVASGKLSGYTQSTYQDCAVKNSRRFF